MLKKEAKGNNIKLTIDPTFQNGVDDLTQELTNSSWVTVELGFEGVHAGSST